MPLPPELQTVMDNPWEERRSSLMASTLRAAAAGLESKGQFWSGELVRTWADDLDPPKEASDA